MRDTLVAFAVVCFTIIVVALLMTWALLSLFDKPLGIGGQEQYMQEMKKRSVSR